MPCRRLPSSRSFCRDRVSRACFASSGHRLRAAVEDVHDACIQQRPTCLDRFPPVRPRTPSHRHPMANFGGFIPAGQFSFNKTSRQLCVDSRTPSSIARKRFSPRSFTPITTNAHNLSVPPEVRVASPTPGLYLCFFRRFRGGTLHLLLLTGTVLHRSDHLISRDLTGKLGHGDRLSSVLQTA